MSESPESPLTTTAPDTLSLIFSSDPTELSDAQLSLAVIELRRRRNAFTAEEAAKALKEKSKREKAEKLPAAEAAKLGKPTSELSLDDL